MTPDDAERLYLACLRARLSKLPDIVAPRCRGLTGPQVRALLETEIEGLLAEAKADALNAIHALDDDD